MKAKYISMSLLAAGTLLTSCSDDFLEVTNPTDFPIEEYFVNKSAMDEAMTAAYAPLHWFDYGSTWQYCGLNYVPDFMSDDLYPNGSSNQDQPFLQKIFQYESTPEDCATGIWSDAYSGVKRCNDVITYTGWATITNDEKESYLAQARLLRAFYYSIIWKFYGNVPCYMENLASPYLSPQLSADEVYEKIASELEDIIDNAALVDEWDADNKGRVTKPMALMLYADIVLYQNDKDRYNRALTQLQSIISSGKFSLTPNFADIWKESGEWNQESIFEINYFDDNSYRGWSNQWGAGGTITPRLCGPRSYTQNAGDDAYSEFGGVDTGWGFGTIALAAVNSYESGDLRRDISCFDMNAHGTHAAGDNGWMDTGYCIGKYLPLKNNNKDQKADADLGFNNNLRIYRYAETLLDAAELLLKTDGSAATAAQYVNLVRSRAGLGNLASVTEDDIINERHHEFMGEGKRYFDLVRTGKAAQVLKAANDPYRNKDWDPTRKYLPIPQGVINATYGTSSPMSQNPGY